MTCRDEKWYFKAPVLVLAFLCIGPFMLPLVWFNPCLSNRKKTVISVIALILSILLGMILSKSLGSIDEYYKLLKQYS